ncbi:hypothetical protein Poli38472_005399 [Pythium oligandrum]|uniref:WW domain-containing protein n=1 Tax=Pythium oligandrum TaxID=41045 RepID=A0A8K1CFY2_PYTOL|nr:hypothetical protein Poli38472_005399 [Pythium oligandrum]|eukprot:TMW62781.1 hypothetical protein Poli38472_005399 [Pythium oligandrum]
MMRSKTMALTSSQRKKPFLPHKKPSAKTSNASAETKKLNHERSLPRLRSGLEMLPILTASGETPFEIGLDASNSPQQHVLPVFRLPAVNVQATATAMTIKQVEMLEEDRDRKQASDALGLSVEEIEMLEAELGGKSHSASRTLPAKASATQLDKKLSGLSDSEKKVSKRRGRHTGGTKRYGASSTKKNLGDSSEIVLRKQLESALYNVQHLTRLVKNDICQAQKVCPASELRTSLYFKRWGKEKVENIFRRLLYNLQGIAFGRWREALEYEKQQEKLQAYLMYKGSKKLDVFILNWTHRKLRQAWTKWWSDIAYAKALERAALELEAICVLQRAYRGYRGRTMAYLVKKKQQYERETAAASKIQRMFRGSIARKFFLLKRIHIRRHTAAIRIQGLARGFLVRQRAKQIRTDRKRFVAASKIQALYRGRKARREVARLRRQERVTKAAVIIQRRYRGRLGRAAYLKKQIERYMAKAAIKIQTMARGWRARRILRGLREERRQMIARQNAATVKIQKVYRGHRSRLGTQLKLIALREKNKMRNRAAVKIQKVARSRQARHTVARLRKERLAAMIALARRWLEYWNEDASQWFYYNQETGEALWAPPPTGYIRADGDLLLHSGKIIPDPGDGWTADTSAAFHARKKPGDAEEKEDKTTTKDHVQDEDEEDEDRLCVECEEEDALRKCDQCEDVYCDTCYEKLHSSAKREKHTWKAIGTMRCIECEKMKATRWCSVCQDPYCLGCFTIIHSKGNKSNHAWTDMATFRKQQKNAAQQAASFDEDAQTYNEFMQTKEYQYVTELTSEEGYNVVVPSSYSQSVPAPTSTENEWSTLYDENSGQYYYYNAYTGESRWA